MDMCAHTLQMVDNRMYCVQFIRNVESRREDYVHIFLGMATLIRKPEFYYIMLSG
jgi:hypothetical protein